MPRRRSFPSRSPATQQPLLPRRPGRRLPRPTPKFRPHLDKHLNMLWSIEPFRSYRNYFNVYAVEIASQQSGIDCDPEIRERAQDAAAAVVRWRLQQHQRARGDRCRRKKRSPRPGYAERATPDADQILTSATATHTAASADAWRRRRAATPSARSSRRTSSVTRSAGFSTNTPTAPAASPEAAYTGGDRHDSQTMLERGRDATRKQKWWQWLGEASETGGADRRVSKAVPATPRASGARAGTR